jgi:uncharacterized RDD family membrane protein YckC
MNVPVALLVPCPNHPQVTEGLGACSQCGRNFCGDCLVQLGGVPTCAGCKLERLSDIRTGVADVNFAGAWTRFAAQFIDGLLFIVPSTVLYFSGFLYSFAPRFGPPPRSEDLARFGIRPQNGTWLPLLFTVLLMFATVVYEALMLTARGQTLGKMALGIKVVTPQGGDIRGGHAWARAFSRSVMNALYFVGLIDSLFIFSGRRRTLHDRIAQTVVVTWKR